MNFSFIHYFIASWATYFFLLTLTYLFSIYVHFPPFGFIGYTMVITLMLFALAYSTKQKHYILVSTSLIVVGAIASFDMILSRDELAAIWVKWDILPLTHYHIESYMDVLIILLNIFTGSIAANSLFFGLNKNNFDKTNKGSSES